MLVMASSTGVAPPSSQNSLEVGHGDGKQCQVIDINNSHMSVHTTSASINPLLLASVCYGSFRALNFLFNREDAKATPMIVPTQAFLDLLVGHNPSNNITRRLTVPQDFDNVENDVYQPSLQAYDLLLQGVTAEGDTALHVLASHGDNTEFLLCANIINERKKDLLLALNVKGDTPLHCAARAGKSNMVSFLTEVARSSSGLLELLRKENLLKETALHDVVRIGNKEIVEQLLEVDPMLANYPTEGTSPLYLAISLEKDIIAHTLYYMSNGNLSYCGPHGENVLHAAIFRGSVTTEIILKWNNSLTTHGDRDGSTPLHFASSLWQYPNRFRQLFGANPTTVYQANNNGLFPIHVAASVGAEDAIRITLERCPSSAGLRTARGHTFFHVAVMERNLVIVTLVCQTPSLAWILNMKDNDGNTALHLAVQARKLRMFSSLFGNKEVQLILRNNKGQTPLDLSRSLLPTGMYYMENTEQKIHMALASVEAKHSFLFRDHIYEKYNQPIKSEDVINEEVKVKDASQMLGIGSVLIATVAFGVTFALPGGYRADDHMNGGTPTLVGRYTFDAFMMANALAFICSSIATIGLMFSGSSMVKLKSRQMNLRTSVFFVSSSLTSLAAAFALGVYMVLAPVAHDTAIAICVFSPLAILYRNGEFLVKLSILARPLCLRMGLIRALKKLTSIIVFAMLKELWPFIFIFGWAAIAKKLRNH